MIKRTNKITALLIAATSIMSMVPAMAADSTRLATKEGTIDQAIAFAGGNYIYDGYKSNDNEKGLYFNDGEKDKLLEDITVTSMDKYSDKYSKVIDGSDEYLVDLSNGTVIEDTSVDKMDSVKAKLKTALSKTDRYGKVASTSDITLTQVLDKQLGETWYSYTATGSAGTYHGYVNEAGNYIDTDVTANINAYSSLKGNFVNVDKFNEEDSNTALKVSMVNQPKVIAEDKDNLYTLVNVDITDTSETATTVATNATAKIDLTSAKYAQIATPVAAVKAKIAITWPAAADASATVKIAGNDFDYTTGDVAGLKTAVADYFISNPIAGFAYDRTAGQFNAVTAGNIIDASIPTFATGDLAVFTNGANAYDDATAMINPSVVLPGKTFTYNAEYTDALSLRNAIIGHYVVSANVPLGYTFDATTLTFTSIATGVTKEAVGLALGTNNLTITAGSAAANGKKVTNTSYIQKISKAQGTQEDKAYIPKNVSSYEVSDVYDSGNADDAVETINADNTTFKVINGVIYATTKDAKKVTVTTIKLMKDKVKFNTGDNKYDVYLAEQDVQEDQDTAGTNAVSVDVDGNTWALDNGRIYKFDGTSFKEIYTCDTGFDTLEVYNADSLIAWEDGKDIYSTVDKQTTTPVETPVTTTGWVNTAAGWTFVDSLGNQVKGQWVTDGGVWYMLKADGIMATGWYNDNGTWYYLNASGAMQTGWVKDGSTWYFLNGSGAMKTGWINNNGTWYFLQSSGAMKTGWLNDNGTWYYLNSNGSMAANTTVDGYKLNASGAWVK